jgi:hypothetical protein
MTAASWRDRLSVHPAADLFPMLAGEELDALANDIRKHGLKQPIVLLQPDPKLPVYEVLDGRNRLNAAERAGFELFTADGKLAWSYFRIVGGDNSFDPIAFVVSANVHRRHLSSEQRRGIVAELLKADSSKSDRAIATQAGSNRNIVGEIRGELEESGDVSRNDTRTDTKGRQQPASKPPRAASKEDQIRALRERSALPPIVPESRRPAAPTADAPSMSQPDAQLVADARRRIALSVPALLTRDAIGGLAHIAQAIERAKVAKSLSFEKRVEAARAFLIALDVRPEDFGGLK